MDDPTSQPRFTELMMSLQKSVTEQGGNLQKFAAEISGKLSRMEEHISQALEIKPKFDLLEDRVLRLENAQSESDKRFTRFWVVTAAVGSILAVLFPVVFWFVQNVKVK